jgi:sporulation protein YlmC with PRC-barrel domain
MNLKESIESLAIRIAQAINTKSAIGHTHDDSELISIDWDKVQNHPTTLSDYGILDAINVTENVALPLQGVDLLSCVSSYTTTAANQLIFQLPIAKYRSAKFIIQLSSGSSYQMTELSAMHDGTNVFVLENSAITNAGTVGDFSVDINAGNMRVLITPAVANVSCFASITATKIN